MRVLFDLWKSIRCCRENNALIEKRSENTDTASGDIYPINSRIQGDVFEKIEGFINPRSRQLIKHVSYTIEVEYYPEDLYDVNVLEGEQND